MTIKAMPLSTRRTIVDGAKRRDESVAEWLARAVAAQARVEAADSLVEPELFELRRPGKPEGDPDKLPSYADVRDLMQATAAMAEASGLPVPRAVARHSYALVTQLLRSARGLPPRKTRRRIGQTLTADGRA